MFVFYVSYACYFLVPAIGPRYTLAHAGPLPRGAIAQAIDHTLDVLEKNKRDCFPSGHTMVLIAVLLEAYRRSKRTFWAFLPFAVGLIAGHGLLPVPLRRGRDRGLRARVRDGPARERALQPFQPSDRAVAADP